MRGSDQPAGHNARSGHSKDATLIAHPLRAQSQPSHCEDSDTYITHPLKAEGSDASEDGTGRGTPIVAQCHGSNVGPAGALRKGNANVTGGVPFVAFHPKASASQSMNPSEICPGLGVTKEPAIAWHENKQGNLSAGDTAKALECERLQGFPDDWTRWGVTEDGTQVELSDSARYRMIGNAVAVPKIKWVMKRIKARIKE